MVSTATQTTIVFVVLGLALWYAATLVTENTVIQFAALLGVGVVLPTLLNERRHQSA